MRSARQAEGAPRSLDAGLRAGEYHASRGRPSSAGSAFAHKGGLHVSAILRNTRTYEHIDPALVGNDRHVVLSELSGRSNIMYKSKEFGLDIDAASNEKIGDLLEEVKRLESEGYTFEGADASFELLMRRTLGMTRTFQLRQLPRLR